MAKKQRPSSLSSKTDSSRKDKDVVVPRASRIELLALSLSQFFVYQMISLKMLFLRLIWYVPTALIAALGIAVVFSPRLALEIFALGCLAVAGGLLIAARVIRHKIQGLLARMPRTEDGQVPKRLELHAVVMGVGERVLDDSLLEDLQAEQLAEVPNSPNSNLDNNVEADNELDDDKDSLSEELSSFEMFEVPELRRDRARKTIIH